MYSILKIIIGLKLTLFLMFSGTGSGLLPDPETLNGEHTVQFQETQFINEAVVPENQNVPVLMEHAVGSQKLTRFNDLRVEIVL
jgi:hypothetical protein